MSSISSNITSDTRDEYEKWHGKRLRYWERFDGITKAISSLKKNLIMQEEDKKKSIICPPMHIRSEPLSHWLCEIEFLCWTIFSQMVWWKCWKMRWILPPYFSLRLGDKKLHLGLSFQPFSPIHTTRIILERVSYWIINNRFNRHG